MPLPHAGQIADIGGTPNRIILGGVNYDKQTTGIFEKSI